MSLDPLDNVPLALFFLIAAGLAGIALEIGYRLGTWRHRVTIEEKDTPAGAMVASILGLLGIMIAFSFNLAANRFDVRRAAVLEEANAIGTLSLRSAFLPESQRGVLSRLLREYVDIRLSAAGDIKILPAAIQRSEEIQEEMWSTVLSVLPENRQSPLFALLIQSLNEVIDLHSVRLIAGVHGRTPVTIWVALFSLALLAMLATGYQAGIAATRRSPAMVLLVFAFAGMLLLIVDLDRPHEGLLRTSQTAMQNLQRQLSTAP